MRIISGEKKGARLFSLKKRKIRPTSDKVKGAIFNILSSVEDKKILDLFAGSGALGIEALSRGAKEVVFVDSSFTSLDLIRKNLEKLGFKDKSRLIKKNVLRFLKDKFEGRFDLILADPPYGKGLCQKVLEILSEKEFLNAEGVLVIEHHKKEKIEKLGNFILLQERKYGDTLVSFFRKIS
ncbi:MAG: 16S rRNA (guanine(966)-N(2))-methyltransferase RsmD [candidate division Zixibacteria bacterium RBG_16_43_9]|nr:MAG: 16S rRNA (guanine(966)-N(2))-methyltransferase RsmD [candidate division Zixibacteria bacterium RBG_16_43_9]